MGFRLGEQRAVLDSGSDDKSTNSTVWPGKHAIQHPLENQPIVPTDQCAESVTEKQGNIVETKPLVRVDRPSG
jgi:hypothetical protein